MGSFLKIFHAMNWATRKRQMGVNRELACLSLLLLLLSQSEIACYASGYGNFNRFKGGSGNSAGSEMSHVTKSNSGDSKGNAADKEADEIFGAEKRKVYTGPNPLHNR